MLTKTVCENCCTERVLWPVPASKLQENSRCIVSPFFELFYNGRSTKFKLLLFPGVSSEGKRSSSFRVSGGQGFMQIKCEEQLGRNQDETPGTLADYLLHGAPSPRKEDQHAAPGSLADYLLHGAPGSLKFRFLVEGQQPSELVTHNFADTAVIGLPKESETREFDRCIAKGYFFVGVETVH
jgi:hypothetical protein